MDTTPRLGQQVTWRGFHGTYSGTVIELRDGEAKVFYDVDEGRMVADWFSLARLAA